jgi:hypothetical protein
MSEINLGHHNLPTYEISLKSNNVEFVQFGGGHFENGDWYKSFDARNLEKFLAVAIFKMIAKIQHCSISSKFDMWVDYDVPNLFPTLKNF